MAAYDAPYKVLPFGRRQLLETLRGDQYAVKFRGPNSLGADISVDAGGLEVAHKNLAKPRGKGG